MDHELFPNFLIKGYVKCIYDILKNKSLVTWSYNFQFHLHHSSQLQILKLIFFINDGNKKISLILGWLKYVDITKVYDNNVWKKCSFTY
jgi:hypothetical protein